MTFFGENKLFVLSQQRLAVWTPRDWDEDKLIQVLKKIDKISKEKEREIEEELKKSWPEVVVRLSD